MPRKRQTRRGFGSVRELPSGRFQAAYLGPDGNRHLAPTTFATVTDADVWLATVRADVIREVWQSPRRATDTVAGYVDRWIEQHQGLKASTRNLYRKTWAKNIYGSSVGSLPLNTLTPDKVRTWHADLVMSKRVELQKLRNAAEEAGRSYSIATNRTGASVARHAFLLLRAALSTAVDDGLIKSNPCSKVRGAASPVPSKRPILSVDEVLKLANAIFARYSALVLLAAFTGIRSGELAALRCRDLDLTTGRASVSVTERVYKIDSNLDFDEPKSRAGARVVSIPDALARELAEHMARYTDEDPSAFVFTSSNGRVLTPASLAKTWQKARNAIGRPDVRFHDLRHTGQTLAALSGATQAELMQRLGHSTAAASLIYLHSTRDHSRAVAQALGTYLEDANRVPLRSADAKRGPSTSMRRKDKAPAK